MAINISSNFLVGVRDFLDSRQRVETRAGLDSINTFFIPDMFIVYCEEEDCYYQYKEATESWLMLDLNINEYLYELDENGEPDLTKPLYMEEERMVKFDENVIRAWIDDGGQLTAEDELLDYIIDLLQFIIESFSDRRMAFIFSIKRKQILLCPIKGY